MGRAFGTRFWLLLASSAYAALLVVLRGRPSLEFDSGIFLSVAGRLLHGDTLYIDVLDNKDPLFFYSYASALAVDWRAPFLLDVVWLVVAAGSTALLLRAIGATRLTTAVGFVCLPLLLTGAWYFAGYSMLAALSLTSLIGWLWIRGSFALAGALLCVGLLFKLNLGLVLVSAPAVFLLLRMPAGSPRSQVARAAAGFAAAVAAAAAVLALRGELHGYLETVMNNIAYSRDVLGATGRRTGILGHIEATAISIGSPWQFAGVSAAFFLVGVLAVWTLRRGRADSGGALGPPAIRTVAALFLVTTVASSVTLALTAAWGQHSQMLAYPCLMLIVFAVMVSLERPRRPPKVIAASAAAGLLVLAVAASPPDTNGPISTWLNTGRSETADLLERAADERFPQLETTFAHLGANDEEAAGAFLDDRFVLACPDVAQYVFTPDLLEVLRCVRDEKPCVVLVTDTFKPYSDAPAEWNQFVARGSNLLSREYERVLTHETGNEVWALGPCR